MSKEALVPYFSGYTVVSKEQIEAELAEARASGELPINAEAPWEPSFATGSAPAPGSWSNRVEGPPIHPAVMSLCEAAVKAGSRTEMKALLAAAGHAVEISKRAIAPESKAATGIGLPCGKVTRVLAGGHVDVKTDRPGAWPEFAAIPVQPGFSPGVGDIVVVRFEDNDLSRPVAHAPGPAITPEEAAKLEAAVCEEIDGMFTHGITVTLPGYVASIARTMGFAPPPVLDGPHTFADGTYPDGMPVEILPPEERVVVAIDDLV